jgi:hypothetical protein
MPPHAPPIRGYLQDRGILADRSIDCRRPELPIPIAVSRPQTRFFPVSFILDTGSDVTLIPISVANSYQIVGYRQTTWITFSTSWGGELRGSWGTVRIRVGTTETDLICFYYLPPSRHRSSSGTRGRRISDERNDAAGLFMRVFYRFAAQFRPGSRRGLDDGIILGRADFLARHSLIIESGWVGISDRPHLDQYPP